MTLPPDIKRAPGFLAAHTEAINALLKVCRAVLRMAGSNGITVQVAERNIIFGLPALTAAGPRCLTGSSSSNIISGPGAAAALALAIQGAYPDGVAPQECDQVLIDNTSFSGASYLFQVVGANLIGSASVLAGAGTTLSSGISVAGQTIYVFQSAGP